MKFLPLEKRVKADKARKWVTIFLAAAVLVLLCVISHDRCVLWQRIVMYILSALLLFLFVLKTGIIRQMKDTSWEGKVLSKKVKHAFNKSANPRDNRVRLVCIWTVQRNDGKTVKLKFDTDEITENYFVPGETIRHTAGTRYPTRVTVTDKNYICPMCGHSSSHPQCVDCKTDFESVYDKPAVPEMDESLWDITV